MDDSRTEVLPVVPQIAAPGSAPPEETSTIPVVETPHHSRLHRATNALALGRVAEAAALCREELNDVPSSADAYALLAMAEEQSGNRHLAIELYEQLLELDPEREVEAERLEALRREVEEIEAEEPSPEEKEEQLRRMQPLALVILTGAAVLLIASLALLLVVRHRNQVIQGQYQQAIDSGTFYYNQGYYAQAAAWFAQAGRLKPKDTLAPGYYNAAIRQAQAAGTPQSQLPAFYAPAGNPFLTNPYGATGEAAGMPPLPSATVPPGDVQIPPSTHNPWEPTEPVPSQTPGPQLPRGELPEVIKPPRSQTPPPANTPPPAATPPVAPTPPVEQPMIKVEISGHKAPPSAAAARAADLRAQGDSLYNQGEKAAALKAYQKAVTAYQQERSAHPEERRAIDSAIATVTAKMKLCQ